MPDIRNSPKLDDFQRPDEHPVEPPWQQLDVTGVWDNNHLHGHTLANPRNAVPGAHPGDLGGWTEITWCYWPVECTGDFEAWGHRVGGEAGAAGTGWRIGFFRAGSVPTNSQGYIYLLFTALGDTATMRKYQAPEDWDYIESAHYSSAFQSWLMFRKTGALLEGWSASSPTGTWTLLHAAAMDEWVDEPFYVAYGVEDPTGAGTGWAEVGGAQIKRYSQIYRRLRNTGPLEKTDGIPGGIVWDQGIDPPTAE